MWIQLHVLQHKLVAHELTQYSRLGHRVLLLVLHCGSNDLYQHRVRQPADPTRAAHYHVRVHSSSGRLSFVRVLLAVLITAGRPALWFSVHQNGLGDPVPHSAQRVIRHDHVLHVHKHYKTRQRVLRVEFGRVEAQDRPVSQLSQLAVGLVLPRFKIASRFLTPQWLSHFSFLLEGFEEPSRIEIGGVGLLLLRARFREIEFAVVVNERGEGVVLLLNNGGESGRRGRRREDENDVGFGKYPFVAEPSKGRGGSWKLRRNWVSTFGETNCGSWNWKWDCWECELIGACGRGIDERREAEYWGKKEWRARKWRE
ncbi:uncharacterized protein G2W53_024489 [Senna tora]|uniref:Uncharacterized protein n=1 Tax=Senna tora TaxID=362788 RepID=A0A834WJ55_9FABA|nr:uncharacterized protein G2W53_024489 [Senna tora]